MDLEHWSGLTAVGPFEGGHRNAVWRGELRGDPVAIRKSRRAPASLEWELDLTDYLHSQGFAVPRTVRTDSEARHVDGLVISSWLEGRPPSSEADWRGVADELGRLHETTSVYPQRPGCCAVTRLHLERVSLDADLDTLPVAARDLIMEVFAELSDVPVSVVHGDPGPGNVRVDGTGRVGLLDWDESRVDLTWHDLSNLGIQILDDVEHRRAEQLSHAWEAVNGWSAEPSYASKRLAQLRTSRRGPDIP